MAITREEMLRVSAALNRPKAKPIVAGSRDAEQMTHTRPSGEGVPIAAMPPPAAPAEKKPSEPPKKPGPKPADVAAAKGVAAPDPTRTYVPRETSPAAPAAPAAAAVPPEQDKPAFSYLAQVEAMERRAMEIGRPEEAARVRGEYNRLIDGQFRTLETNFKTKTLPQVQAMQAALLEHQGKQLPRELAIQARQVTLQAAQQQQEMLGYIYGLVRNDATKGLGVKYFNESELLEPSVQVADFIVDDQGMLVGLDAQGGVVKMSSGEEFRFPVEAAEQLYRDLFESERNQNVILPDGAMLVGTNGQVRAHNEKAATTESAGNARMNVKMGTDALARRLGIELDATGRLMEGVDENTRQRWLELSALVEQEILRGTPPQQAADNVWRTAGGTAAASGAAPYSGPAIYR